MTEKLAKIISIVFNPLIIPTLGFLLLLNTGFYFSMISWEAKRFVLLVVLFTTCILPMLTIAVLALNPKFDISMSNHKERVLPMLFTSVFYYLGYLLMNKMKAFSVFNLILIASIIVILILLAVSFKWKVSSHMAAIGSLTGTFFALAFRLGINPLWPILSLIVIAGAVGSARIKLHRHTFAQVAGGYLIGFLVLYITIYFF